MANFTDINLPTGVGWTTINFENHAATVFAIRSFALPDLGIPSVRKTGQPRGGSGRNSARNAFIRASPGGIAFLIDYILLYFAAV